MDILNDLVRAVTPVGTTSWIVVGLIGALFLFCIFLLVKENYQIMRERGFLREWQFRVRSHEPEEVIRAIENTYPESESEPRPDLVTNGLQSICKARDGLTDLEAICSMLSQSEARRLGFPMIVPNLLMLLGLLGTVLGLSSAIVPLSDQIMGAARNVDPQLLAASLQVTLASMSAAFVATLWGISTAFITGYLLRRVANKQDALLEDVQDFIISDVGPKILPRSREASIQELSESVKKVGTFMRKMPKLMDEAAERFHETLSVTSSDMKENLRTLQASAAEIQNQMIQSGSDLKASADSLGDATKAVTVAAADLEKDHTDLRNSHQEILESNERSRMRFEAQVTEQLAAIEDFRKDVSHSSSDVVDRIARASDTYERCSTNFKSAAEAASKSVENYQEAVTFRFDQLHDSVHDLFKRHAGAADKVSDELREMTGRLAPSTLDREWNEMKSMISKLDATFQTLSLGQGSGGVQELRGVVERLERVLTSHSKALELPVQPSTPAGQPIDPTLVRELQSATSAMQGLANAIQEERRVGSPGQPVTPTTRNGRARRRFDASRLRAMFGRMRFWK